MTTNIKETDTICDGERIFDRLPRSSPLKNSIIKLVVENIRTTIMILEKALIVKK